MKSEALLSPDHLYRYWLLRVWDGSLPILCLIGVNPSTADEKENDATIRKGIGFAQRLGYGGILMLNVGAGRARDPKKWAQMPDPIGPLNTPSNIIRYLEQFGRPTVVCCWGRSISRFASQASYLVESLRVGGFEHLWCWGKNSDGTPKHPLMLPYSTQLEEYS